MRCYVMAVAIVPLSSFVTGVVLLFYRCLEMGRVTQKEKEIIEACALNRYASCIETVARATLLSTSLKKKADALF